MECRINARELAPGVFCLTDRMGMHMTLLCGAAQALLIDTGYGFDDLNAAVRQITSLPLRVINTHGHHDHACGNDLFSQVELAAAELPICADYVASQRERVWRQARERGVDLADWHQEDYLCRGCGTLRALTCDRMDLGGLTAHFLESPGHTPGSLAVYVPERRLLMTGDDWNPTTWLFFPEAEGIACLRRSILRLLALDFDWVLPAHDARLWPRHVLQTFYDATSPEQLRAHAVPAPGMYPGKRVMLIHPQPGHSLYYDADKAEPEPPDMSAPKAP